MIGIITLMSTILMIFIHNGFEKIRIELKYRNRLLEEQNNILENKTGNI